MKAYIAALRTETNSFVERLTTYDDFLAGDVTKPGGPIEASRHPGAARFVECARLAGLEASIGPAAYAVPGGPVEQKTYNQLRAALLEPLEGDESFDLVFLDIHGAMSSQSIDDCDGDLIAAVRERVGPETVIAVLIDPHASLSTTMLDSASIVHAYKEYPHTDVAERAGELFDIALKAANGLVQPVAAVSEIRALGGFPTTREPMSGFVTAMQRDEAQAGILSVSLIHGFPWSDTDANGAKALVYADGDERLAQGLADDTADRFAALVNAVCETVLNLKDGIEVLRSHPSTQLVVADTSDNPGGGGDGDSMHLLNALKEAGFSRVGAALICDPQALDVCLRAGEGAAVDLELGGRASKFSGTPLRVKGHVAAVVDQIEAGDEAAAGPPVGPVVRLRCPWADFIICGVRREALWKSVFTATGVELSDYQLIVLKSSNHFRAAFESVADAVISIGSPTAMNPDLASLPFKKLTRPMWPLDDTQLVR